MQPNQPGQQGYYQPDQNQPVQPVAPVSPQPVVAAPAPQPVAVAAPIVPAPTPVGELPVSPEQLPQIDPADDQETLSDAPVSWSAFEYIHQEKGKTWFIVFALVMAAFFGVAVFFQQWSFAVLIIVIAAVIIVSSKRPPRELTYAITDDGLSIDGKLHTFESFKAFGIIRDGEEFSVMLIPTQRFQPGVTVYFPEEAGEAIVDILGSRLPMKDLHLDAVDRVVRLLRL